MITLEEKLKEHKVVDNVSFKETYQKYYNYTVQYQFPKADAETFSILRSLVNEPILILVKDCDSEHIKLLGTLENPVFLKEAGLSKSANGGWKVTFSWKNSKPALFFDNTTSLITPNEADLELKAFVKDDPIQKQDVIATNILAKNRNKKNIYFEVETSFAPQVEINKDWLEQMQIFLRFNNSTFAFFIDDEQYIGLNKITATIDAECKILEDGYNSFSENYKDLYPDNARAVEVTIRLNTDYPFTYLKELYTELEVEWEFEGKDELKHPFKEIEKNLLPGSELPIRGNRFDILKGEDIPSLTQGGNEIKLIRTLPKKCTQGKIWIRGLKLSEFSDHTLLFKSVYFNEKKEISYGF